MQTVSGGTLKAARLCVSGAERGLEVCGGAVQACIDLSECDLHARAGVLARGPRVKVSMEQCKVSASRWDGIGTAGAVFWSGAVGRLDAFRISNVYSGVVVGEGSLQQEIDCVDDVGACDLGEDCEPLPLGPGSPCGARDTEGEDGAVSQVTMANVDVDAEGFGVSVWQNGGLDATRVTVSNSHVGFQIEGQCENGRSRMARCRAVGCGRDAVGLSCGDGACSVNVQLSQEAMCCIM